MVLSLTLDTPDANERRDIAPRRDGDIPEQERRGENAPPEASERQQPPLREQVPFAEPLDVVEVVLDDKEGAVLAQCGEVVQRGRVVAVLPAEIRRRRHQDDVLIAAECRGREEPPHHRIVGREDAHLGKVQAAERTILQDLRIHKDIDGEAERLKVVEVARDDLAVGVICLDEQNAAFPCRRRAEAAQFAKVPDVQVHEEVAAVVSPVPTGDEEREKLGDGLCHSSSPLRSRQKNARIRRRRARLSRRLTCRRR